MRNPAMNSPSREGAGAARGGIGMVRTTGPRQQEEYPMTWKSGMVGLALLAGSTTALAGTVNLAAGTAILEYDSVAYSTLGRAVPGDPAITASHEGATYRFASAADRDLFTANPAAYVP
jgi:hypothetical protein